MPLKRRTQKMFDSVTEQIKNQIQGGLKVNPETGVKYEEPLEEKHPGITIGVMAAQPGTILEKVLAPSVYKGIAKSIGEGNLSEALISSIVSPVKTKLPTKIKTKDKIAELKQKYDNALDESLFIDEIPVDSKTAKDLKKNFAILKVEDDIKSAIEDINKKIPKLSKKSDDIYHQITRNYDKNRLTYDFDIKKYADDASGLTNALDELERLYNIDPYKFAPMSYWGSKSYAPLPIENDILPFKQGGKLKRK